MAYEYEICIAQTGTYSKYIETTYATSNEIKVPDDSTKFWARFNHTGASYVMLRTYCMLRAGL